MLDKVMNMHTIKSLCLYSLSLFAKVAQQSLAVEDKRRTGKAPSMFNINKSALHGGLCYVLYWSKKPLLCT